MRTISNSFTVNTVEDGAPAPFYSEDYYAWSNVSSTTNATTEPRPNSGWQKTIGTQEYTYLWKKTITYTWNSTTEEYDTYSTQYTKQSGEKGDRGRFYYYAGVFNVGDNTTLFAVSKAQAPYFSYTNASNTLRYWVFNPEDEGSYTMAEMGTPSSSDDNWEIMTNDFKYIITEALFTNYATLASFVIKGNLLFSVDGKWNSDSSDISGDSLVSYECYTVSGNGTFTYNTESAAAYTFINVSSPETREEEIFSETNITNNYETDNITFESGKTYRVYVDGVTPSSISLRNRAYGSPIDTAMVDDNGYVFQIHNGGTYSLYIETSASASYSVYVYERYFSPNVAINGQTGKTVLNNIFSRGTFNGIGRLTELMSRQSYLYGETHIEQPFFKSDYADDDFSDTTTFARIPKYRKVVVVAANSLGVEQEVAVGRIIIEDETGYLRFIERP